MRGKTLSIKLGALIAPVVAAIALGAPGISLAAAPVLVDDSATATDCGNYTGQTASTSAYDAINTASSGQTVLICPGTYSLDSGDSGGVHIQGKRLTIRRATTGEGSVPVLNIDPDVSNLIYMQDASVTLEGLELSAVGSGQLNIGVISVFGKSTLKAKNVVIRSGTAGTSWGIVANPSDQGNTVSVSLSNSAIRGYSFAGISANGKSKVTVMGSVLDGSDNGRVDNSGAYGVFFSGASGYGSPSGMVTKSALLNNYGGIGLQEAAKVRITNNLISGNDRGIEVYGGSRRSVGISISGNTINVPAGGRGIFVYDSTIPAPTIIGVMVSRNTISADTYNDTTDTNIIAIFAELASPAGSKTTVTLSGNSIFGFPVGQMIHNSGSNAKITQKGNAVAP